ncbi:MAG: hypothetical protein WA655_15720 [Candidatus Korobacteraceae bacterium]
MPDTTNPIIAIVGNIKTHADAAAAAEALGHELAKAGMLILVYSSEDTFLEGPVVKGYVGSGAAGRRSIQVCYPLNGRKPQFPERTNNPKAFDWRPDNSPDWEVSFYQSLKNVDGVLLMGGGESTLIAGLVAMGYGKAVLAIPGFEGKACKVWETLMPGRDLVSADEKSIMARPDWSDDQAEECVKALQSQMDRKAEQEKQRKLEERRRETKVTWHALVALVLFLLATVCILIAWTKTFSSPVAIALLFVSPLLAGVAGSTIRLVFDLRQGTLPLSSQSAITTAALGLIAGGVAGLLFIIAQVTTAPTPSPSPARTTAPQQVAKPAVPMPPYASSAAAATPATTPEQATATVETPIIATDQAKKLVPFAVIIGLIAGMTLDAVFRKLIASDVVDVSVVEAKKRP